MTALGEPYEQAGEVGLQILLHDFACVQRDWRLTPVEVAALLRTTVEIADRLLVERKPGLLGVAQWNRLRHCIALSAALKGLIGPEVIPYWLRTANAGMKGEVPVMVLTRDEGALPFFARILAAEVAR